MFKTAKEFKGFNLGIQWKKVGYLTNGFGILVPLCFCNDYFGCNAFVFQVFTPHGDGSFFDVVST